MVFPLGRRKEKENKGRPAASSSLLLFPIPVLTGMEKVEGRGKRALNLLLGLKKKKTGNGRRDFSLLIRPRKTKREGGKERKNVIRLKKKKKEGCGPRSATLSLQNSPLQFDGRRKRKKKGGRRWRKIDKKGEKGDKR